LAAGQDMRHRLRGHLVGPGRASTHEEDLNLSTLSLRYSLQPAKLTCRFCKPILSLPLCPPLLVACVQAGVSLLLFWPSIAAVDSRCVLLSYVSIFLSNTIFVQLPLRSGGTTGLGLPSVSNIWFPCIFCCQAKVVNIFILLLLFPC